MPNANTQNKNRNTLVGGLTLVSQPSTQCPIASGEQGFWNDAGTVRKRLANGQDEAAIGDITSVVAGAGMTGGGTSGAVTLNVIAGDGIDVAADEVAVDASDFAGTGLEDDGSNNLRIA